ncbi:transcriptional regulator [Glaciimonas immobilis]|uniref:DNA-binding transcriptional regulator YdaS (Cro superfamily) n=1 Tax=Glaciimonas immobilis TaxID=728004 RepID=A0A840RV91_9BURK|nr:YdaS family helix-turn-helix protein [Glaciimonas immobilis]KAF3997513.1 helix-turn-helix domain-containing protein [Glaciimonas immobilis]MBB5200806.1 DNA-binding transcriptional regulator YdaS (Cro superfamily) [Glaciimonas immobilis]
MEKLLKHLNSLSKVGRIQFATACGTTEGYLRKAVSIGQRLNPELCINIERESRGEVRCESLLPDVDWGYLRRTSKNPATPPT